MSINREDFGVEYEVTAGTTKTLTATVIDPDTGSAKSLADTDVYATGIAKIYKPDGTQIGANMSVNYGDSADRLAGLIKFTVLATSQSTNTNAGNWIGEFELSNVTPVVIDQQFFNIKIRESY